MKGDVGWGVVIMIIFCAIMIFVSLCWMGEVDKRDKDPNNPNRPENCNTTRTSECFRVQRDACDFPFAPIIWSEC